LFYDFTSLFTFIFFLFFSNIRRFLPVFKDKEKKTYIVYFTYKQSFLSFKRKQYPFLGFICLLLFLLLFPTFIYFYLIIIFKLSKEIFTSKESYIYLFSLAIILFVHYISFQRRNISLTIALYTNIFLILWSAVNKYLFIFTGLELKFQNFIIYLIPFIFFYLPKDFIPSLLFLIITFLIINLLGFFFKRKSYLLPSL